MTQESKHEDVLAVLVLTPDEQDTLNGYLKEGVKLDDGGNPKDHIVFLKTVDFPDGFQADYKLVGTAKPCIEVALFNQMGYQVAAKELKDAKTVVHGSSARFDVDGALYTVLVHIPTHAGFAHVTAEERLLNAAGVGATGRA